MLALPLTRCRPTPYPYPSPDQVLLFARGLPRMTFSYMRYPVMSVHATSLFYYVIELFLTVRTMVDLH